MDLLCLGMFCVGKKRGFEQNCVFDISQCMQDILCLGTPVLERKEASLLCLDNSLKEGQFLTV